MTGRSPTASGGEGADTDPPALRCRPGQLFAGLAIGTPAGTVVCTACDTAVVEGQRVGVYAYQRAEGLCWDTRRAYCADCVPATLSSPTLGVAELIVRGWVGTLALPRTRTHRPCLVEVQPVIYSPPTEGCPP